MKLISLVKAHGRDGNENRLTVFQPRLESFRHEADGAVPLGLVCDGAVLQGVVLNHPLKHTARQAHKAQHRTKATL